MHATKTAGPRVVDWRWFGLILAALSAIFSPAAAADDLCGATIVADLELDHDLSCPVSGLIVGADGITLDLNGHTIAGPGSGVGILVVGRTDVSILGGTITNFQTGVRVADSSAVVITGNELSDNTDGVDCQAGCSGSTINENEFRDNSVRAIMLRGGSSDNLIKENTFTGNRVGILVNGSLDSVIKENIVSSSLLADIRIGPVATGNLIKENTVSSSPAGIEIVVIAEVWASGNSVIENTAAANTCGIKGPLTGNTFAENVFVGNVTDICS